MNGPALRWLEPATLLALAPVLASVLAGLALAAGATRHAPRLQVEGVVTALEHRDGQTIPACHAFASTLHEQACFSWQWASIRPLEATVRPPQLGSDDLLVSAELCLEQDRAVTWARPLSTGDQVLLSCRQDPLLTTLAAAGPRWCLRLCDDGDLVAGGSP